MVGPSQDEMIHLFGALISRLSVIKKKSGGGELSSQAVWFRVSHGARPVHQIISMIKRIRTSRLSIKNSLSRVEGFGVTAGTPPATE